MDEWDIFESATATPPAKTGGGDEWDIFESAMPTPSTAVAETPTDFDYLNGDLSQTEGFTELSPEWQAQMAKLQEGWRDAGQPDPAAEQAATEWWQQKQQDEAVGELPADATELERLTFDRRKELITSEPSDAVDLPALQAAYENETDPDRKQALLVEFQTAQRRDEIRRAQLAGDVADIKWTGSSPDRKIMEERYAAEAASGPDMALANAPIMRGAMTGVQNAASGVAEAALRILPGEGAPSQLADKLGRIRAAEGQYQSFLDERQGNAAALPNAITQMTGEYLPLAAAGVPAPLQVGAKAMNDAYLQSDDDGYALTSAVVQGALTYAGGKLAGGTFIDMLGGKVAQKAAGQVLKGFGVESGEELGQLYGQAMIDRGFGVGDGRMPTAKEALWTLAVVAGSRGIGTLMSQNIEDDGVATPTLFEEFKKFSDRKWPSRKDAKDAGVDQVATTAKERSELAADIRTRLTGDQFTQHVKDYTTSPQEATDILKVYDILAQSAGESFDDYIGTRIGRVEKTTREETSKAMNRVIPAGRRAEVDFETLKADGLAVIRFFEDQTAASFLHETAHLAERDLKGDQLKAAMKWSGATGGRWTSKSREKFARGWERFFRDGVAPNAELEEVFSNYKQTLTKIYSVVEKSPLNVDISPEIRGVFDRMLTPSEPRAEVASPLAETRNSSEALRNTTPPVPTASQPQANRELTANSDILAQAPVSPDLAAKNASMDEARAAMGLPEINKPAAPGANMPHHVAEQEAIRQRIPERAAGIVMDMLSDKRTEPLSQLETAGLRVYGDRLNEVYARLSEDVNNLTLDEDERMMKGVELERVKQDFDLLSRATRQSGTAQSLAFSQRKFGVGEDFRPLTIETEAAVAKKDKLTPKEKQKIGKSVREHAAAEKKLADQEKKEAAQEKQAAETGKKKIKTEVKKLKEKIAKTKLPTDLNKHARDLAKQYLAEGVVSRRELIDKVQKAVREVFPDTQRRQIIDAISGYGNFTQLSKDEVSVRLRDLKGQLQQISKLKDMSEGKAPAKTGMERRDPSDTERALIKEVNEAKKEGNYEVTDPAKQLASALSTIKTRLRNQIKDLQDQINSREKLIKTKKAPPSDEETKRLTEERDAVKQQFEEMFGKPEMTEAQRLAIAERAVKKSITEYERRLAAGEYPDPPVSKTPQTPELLKLRAERDRLRSQYQSGKPVSLDEKKRIEAATNAVEKSIADLERRLKEGDYSRKAKRPAANDPKLKALRDRAELLRKKYAETNPNPPSLEKAKERLATLEAHLKAGTLPTVTPRTEAKNPAVKAIQQQLTDARKQLSESEPAQKARLLKTIGELNAKLEAGNFSLPEGASRPISPEIERLQYERDKARRKIRSEINNLRPKTIWGHASEPFNLTRQAITTLDLPPVFRQGAFISTANPVRAGQATAAGMKVLFSDFKARKALDEMKARPNAPLYSRGELYLGELNGPVSAREEAFVGGWVEKIPVLRSIVAASERNYTVFLNRLRVDTFDAMIAALSRNGEPTMTEVRAIARFINVATGRGDFGGLEQAMTGLAPVFFSPRYAASRFQLLAGQPMYGGTARTRKLIAQEYGKSIAGAGLIILLATAAGAELEKDGKLKVGNTRFDIFGGLSQTAKVSKTVGEGMWKTASSWFGDSPREYNYANDEAQAVYRFFRSKFSPLAALAMNMATGKTVGRDEVTPAQIVYDNSVALSLRDVSDVVEEQGFVKGAAMWLTSLFGVGMNTYEDN